MKSYVENGLRTMVRGSKQNKLIKVKYNLLERRVLADFLYIKIFRRIIVYGPNRRI